MILDGVAYDSLQEWVHGPSEELKNATSSGVTASYCFYNQCLRPVGHPSLSLSPYLGVSACVLVRV